MDLLNAISAIPGVGPLLPYLAALVALCSAVAPFLPPPKEGASGAYPALYGVVNFVALNLGHARNATAPTVAPKPPVALLALLATGLALSACSEAQQAAVNAKLVHAAQLPAGQLFCRVQQDGGGAMLVAVVDAGVAGLMPGAEPVSVIATGAAKSYVDSVCAQAGGAPAPGPVDLNAVVAQVAVAALTPKG